MKYQLNLFAVPLILIVGLLGNQCVFAQDHEASSDIVTVIEPTSALTGGSIIQLAPQ
jgi:hypothetical protein